MSDSKIPRIVPLPEVGGYTDDVIFGNLGLPVGFDDERILINLRGINRVRTVAGLGTVSIIGERGDTSSYDYSVTSMDSSGTATFGASSKKRKVPRAEGDVTFPKPSTVFCNPDVTITVNTTETQERNKELHGLSGLYEPRGIAKQLNTAMKQGLTGAVIDANMDIDKFKMSARMYGVLGGLGVLYGNSLARTLMVSIIAGPVFANLAIFRNATLEQMMNKDVDPFDVWKEYRQSLFVGVALDRVAVANGLLKATRLIKAQS